MNIENCSLKEFLASRKSLGAICVWGGSASTGYAIIDKLQRQPWRAGYPQYAHLLWRDTPMGLAAYEAARAEAQARADASGLDVGIEISDTCQVSTPVINVRFLPQKKNRNGYNAFAEVVMCSDLAKCMPGHGPLAKGAQEHTLKTTYASLEEYDRKCAEDEAAGIPWSRERHGLPTR